MVFEHLINELVEAQQEAENLGLTEIANEIEDLMIIIGMSDPSPEDIYGDPISNYDVFGHI